MACTPVTLGPATPADIDALVGLLDELFAIEQDFAPDPLAQRQGLTLLLQQRERAVILVARNDTGRAVAMASVQLVISTAQGAPSAWIEDLVVHRDYRGQQIGRQLLGAAVTWARERGATRAQLLVDMDNAPALNFYDHLGWETTHLVARRLML